MPFDLIILILVFLILLFNILTSIKISRLGKEPRKKRYLCEHQKKRIFLKRAVLSISAETGQQGVACPHCGWIWYRSLENSDKEINRKYQCGECEGWYGLKFKKQK